MNSSKPHSPRRADRSRAGDKKSDSKSQAAVDIGSDQLSLFLGQTLQVAGDIFVKTSRYQRSKRYHAELRGNVIVVFRNAQSARSSDIDISAIVSFIVLPYYRVDVVKREQGSPRIYFFSEIPGDDSLTYVKVNGGSHELDAWRIGLARAQKCPLPNLEDLTIEHVIGRGGGGKVFMVHWKKGSFPYALKVIDKAHAFKSKKSFRHVTSERTLMETAGNHPFLLQMQFAFQTEKNLFIGTPFCHGGDLGSYIRSQGIPLLKETGKPGRSGEPGNVEKKVKRTSGKLSESQTRRIAAEIILGLEHLHKQGIVYRDLKPENVLIDKEGHVKIGDYGLAKYLADNIGLNELRSGSVCGTRNYIAPEMVFGKMYSLHADMWSLGVMIYRMLIGEFPFEAQRSKDLFAKMKTETHKIPSSISAAARRLINGLLEKDPQKRPTIQSIRDEPFFRNVNWEDVYYRRAGESVPDVEVGESAGDALRNFELTRLEGITIGDYVKAEKEETDLEAVNIRGGGKKKKNRSGEERDVVLPLHLQDMSRMIPGFEFGLMGRDTKDPPPLEVKLQRNGSFWKLTSNDVEATPWSPRVSPRGYGREGAGAAFLKSPRSIIRISSKNALVASPSTDKGVKEEDNDGGEASAAVVLRDREGRRSKTGE